MNDVRKTRWPAADEPYRKAFSLRGEWRFGAIVPDLEPNPGEGGRDYRLVPACPDGRWRPRTSVKGDQMESSDHRRPRPRPDAP